MKIPEYTLKKPLAMPTAPGDDPLEFPAGTLVQPFSEHNLPKHIKEELDEYVKTMFYGKAAKYVMCLIGTRWVPVNKEEIRISK